MSAKIVSKSNIAESVGVKFGVLNLYLNAAIIQADETNLEAAKNNFISIHPSMSFRIELRLGPY